MSRGFELPRVWRARSFETPVWGLRKHEIPPMGRNHFGSMQPGKHHWSMCERRACSITPYLSTELPTMPKSHESWRTIQYANYHVGPNTLVLCKTFYELQQKNKTVWKVVCSRLELLPIPKWFFCFDNRGGNAMKWQLFMWTAYHWCVGVVDF